MKRFIFFVLFAALFFSCESPVIYEKVTENPKSSGVSIDFAGSVFKGPFLVGSTVRVQQLDENLQQTGLSFDGDIVSNTGEYDISGVPFDGIVELVASGYYFDEVSGNITNSQMSLRALTDKSGTININVATAIERDRVRSLFQGGMSFDDAKEQALSELWNQFGWTASSIDSTDIKITGPDGDKLLALSSMLAMGENGQSREASEVNALITQLRTDFSDGSISSELLDSFIWPAVYIEAESIKANLENYYNDLGLSVSVPLINTALNTFISMQQVGVLYDGFFTPDKVGQLDVNAGFGYNTLFYIPSGQSITVSVQTSADVNDVIIIESGTDFTKQSESQYIAVGPGVYFVVINIPRLSSGPYPYNIDLDFSGAVSYSIELTVYE